MIRGTVHPSRKTGGTIGKRRARDRFHPRRRQRRRPGPPDPPSRPRHGARPAAEVRRRMHPRRRDKAHAPAGIRVRQAKAASEAGRQGGAGGLHAEIRTADAGRAGQRGDRPPGRVHPEWRSRPAHGRFLRSDRPAVRSTTGRRRLNLHGAPSLETMGLTTGGGGRIDAGTTLRPLRRLERDRPGSRVVHVFPGNARHRHAKALRPFLERRECRVRPRFPPPYAPHPTPSSVRGASCTAT